MTHTKKVKSDIIGYALVLPALFIFCLMILYPFINSIYLSFTDAHLIFPRQNFIGFDNYIRLFNDPYLFQLIKVTGTFVFFATVTPFVLGFIWAIIMNQKFVGSDFFRGLTLVNWIVPGIAIGFLWSWIFNGNYGILNGLLGKAGLIESNIPWLGSKSTAMLTVIVARSWQMFPWYMAFILGGLQGVSLEQLEAAKIDGANNIQTFRHIIIPSVKPILLLILLLGVVGNLQHFDLINVMTDGGPERSTSTFATAVYQRAFKEWEVGQAAAMGTIWALILGILGIVYISRVKDDR